MLFNNKFLLKVIPLYIIISFFFSITNSSNNNKYENNYSFSDLSSESIELYQFNLEEIISNKINTNEVEELNKTIYYSEKGDITRSINIFTYYNDTLYNEYINLRNLKYKGVEFSIKEISGKVEIYKYKCINYPNCSNNSNLMESFQILGQTSEIVYADEIIEKENKYFIVVFCKDICKFKIKMHKIEEYVNIDNEEGLIKYLEYVDDVDYREDKYRVQMKSGFKCIIDLIVYSGDAFIILNDGNFNDYDFHYKIENLGSNERWTFYNDESNNNNNIPFHNTFHVRANEYGAVYYIYYQVVPNEEQIKLPLEVTIMYPLKNITTIEIPANSLPYGQEDHKYYILFNPINCDLKIRRKEDFTNKFITTKEKNAEIIFGKSPITYEISKNNQIDSDDQRCFYFISSFINEKSDSFIIFPESKSFQFILNNNIRKIKGLFPYATTYNDPQILLRITLYSQQNIDLKIKVGSNKEKNYTIFRSTDILISKETTDNLYELTYKRICPIVITVELINIIQDNDVTIDINIKTLSKVPYFIKTEKFFPDIVMNNDIKYYLAILSQNTKGFILLNFKRGTGKIYAKIFKYTHKEEIRGNDGKFKWPKADSPDLLEFKFVEQKLVFTEKDTENCYKFCYLIFGVEPTKLNQNNNDENSHFFSEYSLGFKYFINKNGTNEKIENFLDLPNDEFIIGDFEENENNYFQFNFPIESNFLIIDFQSENCRIVLSFNNNFNEEDKIKIFNGKEENQIFKIKKEEFIDFYNDYESYLKIKIKLELQNNIFNLTTFNTKYKLRLTAPIDLLENITKIDTSFPVYCENSIIPINGENYCDFLINIEQFQGLDFAEIYATSNNDKEHLIIYGTIVDSNDFAINYNSSTISWPNKINYTFSSLSNKNPNILKFNINNDKSYKILIRVYIDGSFPIFLITHLIRGIDFLFPIPNLKQLISINSNSNIKIPNDIFCNFQLKFIENSAGFNIEYLRNTFTSVKLSRELRINDKMILNIDKNKVDHFSINTNKIKSDNQSDICIMEYSKINEEIPLEEIELYVKNNYIYGQTKNIFFYYFKIEIFEENILFNLIFTELNTAHKIIEHRDANCSELFEINGYIINNTQLQDLKTNKINIIDFISSFNDTKYIGKYDLSLKQVNIIFQKEDILNFNKTNNESIYILVMINKSLINKREYNYISSTITVTSPNIDKTIPCDIYLTNIINKNTKNINHYYYINSLNDDEEMILEFSSTNKNVQILIFNSEFKKIKNQEDIGKQIISIKNYLNKTKLLVKYENSPNKDIFYTFRYFSNKNKNYTFNYKYNSNAKYKYIKDNLFKITINKIKNIINNKYSKCNYYIRLYKDNKTDKNNFGILTFLKEENPFLENKISYDDNLLSKADDSFDIELNIESNINEKVYVDIIAEILKDDINPEYLSYHRIYPKKDDNDTVIIIFIMFACFICIIFCLILILCIFCYSKKNNHLKKKVERISFTLGDDNPYEKLERSVSNHEEDESDEDTPY